MITVPLSDADEAGLTRLARAWRTTPGAVMTRLVAEAVAHHETPQATTPQPDPAAKTMPAADDAVVIRWQATHTTYHQATLSRSQLAAVLNLPTGQLHPAAVNTHHPHTRHLLAAYDHLHPTTGTYLDRLVLDLLPAPIGSTEVAP